MDLLNRIGLLCFGLIIYSCAPTGNLSKTMTATIMQEGFIDCYEPGLKTKKGKDFWCEVSAIHIEGDRLYLGNDHQMPDGRSAVFSVPFSWGNEGISFGGYVYQDHPLFKIGSKYEEFAKTPDGKMVFLMTGFDRVHDSGSDLWDGFNSLLYWKEGNAQNPKVVSVTGKDSTSISIRPHLAKVLRNDVFPEAMPYFKTEALTVFDDKLLIGVREMGKNYSDFDFAAKIIMVSYEKRGNEIYLKEDYKIFSDLEPNKLAPNIKEHVALSAIEFHPKQKLFYLLTSFEDDENRMGAYLWVANFKDLKRNRMYLMHDPAGNTIKFDHKAEDLSFINDDTLLVVHDDDKEITEVKGIKRMPHQAVYSILKLRP